MVHLLDIVVVAPLSREYLQPVAVRPVLVLTEMGICLRAECKLICRLVPFCREILLARLTGLTGPVYGFLYLFNFFNPSLSINSSCTRTSRSSW